MDSHIYTVLSRNESLRGWVIGKYTDWLVDVKNISDSSVDLAALKAMDDGLTQLLSADDLSALLHADPDMALYTQNINGRNRVDWDAAFRHAKNGIGNVNISDAIEKDLP